MTLKITARQLETAARRFFATCAAAQLTGNIGRELSADGPQTVGPVIQPFQTVDGDIFIW